MRSLFIWAALALFAGVAFAGELSGKLQKVDSEFSFRYKQRTLQVAKQFITLRGSEDKSLNKQTLAYHLEFTVVESARVPIRMVQIELLSGNEKLATIGAEKITFTKAWKDSKVYVSVSLEDIPLLLLDDVDVIKVY